MFNARSSRLIGRYFLFAVVLSLAVATLPQIGRSGGDYGLTAPEDLELFEGEYVVRDDDTVVENLEIHGTLRIIANDVVVRNVWVYAVAPWTIYVQEGSATFENVEVGHPDYIGERGIGGNNVTARLLDIHHVEDGIKLGDDSLYEEVYVHDLASLSADPHADAVQADGGSSNAIIRDSVLDSTGDVGKGNASVFIKSDLGPIDGVIVTGSYLNGGAYTVFVRDGGNGFPSGVSFVGNVFGPVNQFGVTDIEGTVGWSSNLFEATGQVIGPDGVLGDVSSTTLAVAPPPSSTTTTSTTTTTTTTVVSDPGGGEVSAAPAEPTSEGFSTTQMTFAILISFAVGMLVSAAWVGRTQPRHGRQK